MVIGLLTTNYSPPSRRRQAKTTRKVNVACSVIGQRSGGNQAALGQRPIFTGHQVVGYQKTSGSERVASGLVPDQSVVGETTRHKQAVVASDCRLGHN